MTPTPITTAAINVRGARIIGQSAEVDAEQPNSASMPLATATPPRDAADRGEHAHDERLADDRAPDLRRVGADRAQQRELTRALPEHDGERVVDDEDRHEQGDAAEAEQDVADDVDLAG